MVFIHEGLVNLQTLVHIESILYTSVIWNLKIKETCNNIKRSSLSNRFLKDITITFGTIVDLVQVTLFLSTPVKLSIMRKNRLLLSCDDIFPDDRKEKFRRFTTIHGIRERKPLWYRKTQWSTHNIWLSLMLSVGKKRKNHDKHRQRNGVLDILWKINLFRNTNTSDT